MCKVVYSVYIFLQKFITARFLVVNETSNVSIVQRVYSELWCAEALQSRYFMLQNDISYK